MKLYIQNINGAWGRTIYRDDFENVAQEIYNAQGWYDFEPTPQPEVDIDVGCTHELCLDDQNVTRYRWTQTRKTGEALTQATQQKWRNIRFDRNELLSKSDFTQVADSPLTSEKRGEWATYRQALRDITSQPDPFNITWPVSPDGRVAQIGVARV